MVERHESRAPEKLPSAGCLDSTSGVAIMCQSQIRIEKTKKISWKEKRSLALTNAER